MYTIYFNCGNNITALYRQLSLQSIKEGDLKPQQDL